MQKQIRPRNHNWSSVRFPVILLIFLEFPCNAVFSSSLSTTTHAHYAESLVAGKKGSQQLYFFYLNSALQYKNICVQRATWAQEILTQAGRRHTKSIPQCRKQAHPILQAHKWCRQGNQAGSRTAATPGQLLLQECACIPLLKFLF